MQGTFTLGEVRQEGVPVKAVVVGAIGHVAGLIWTKKKSFCARGSGSDE